MSAFTITLTVDEVTRDQVNVIADQIANLANMIAPTVDGVGYWVLAVQPLSDDEEAHGWMPTCTLPMRYAVQVPAYEVEGYGEMPAKWLQKPGWKAKDRSWEKGRSRLPHFSPWPQEAKTWVSREAAQRNADALLDTYPTAIVVEVES